MKIFKLLKLDPAKVAIYIYMYIVNKTCSVLFLCCHFPHKKEFHFLAIRKMLHISFRLFIFYVNKMLPRPKWTAGSKTCKLFHRLTTVNLLFLPDIRFGLHCVSRFMQRWFARLHAIFSTSLSVLPLEINSRVNAKLFYFDF